ncbi:MAG: hypothetical protein ACKVXR_10940 [Planctomycetota bacterium]
MSGRRALVVGLALAAALLAVHALALGYESDDAYISYRYARNLLDGHGLVYNPGERVEGYTNFLWTVLLAGIDGILPGERLPEIATALGILFGGATVVLVGLFGRSIAGTDSPRVLIAPFLLAADSSFAAWCTGGLEGPLFAFLVAAAAFAHFRARGEAPFLFALAALTRPEGALLFAVTAGIELVRRRGRIGKVILWSLPFAAVFVPYFLWRWSYYGYPLPNTFYAKVGGGSEAWIRGAKYLAGFLRTHGWFLALAAVIPVLRRRSEPWVAHVAAMLGAYALYLVAVGGDGLYGHRFCTYLAPLFYLLAQEGLAQALARAPKVLLPAVAVLGVALVAQTSVVLLWMPRNARWTEPKSELSFPDASHGYRFFDPYFVERQRIAAEWLEASLPKGAMIASTPAGSIAYHSSHPVIDMLGLNDVHIARTDAGSMGRGRAGHEKGDGVYVLSRQPEVILLGNVAVLARPLAEEEMPAKLVQRSEKEIWASPEFHRDYERVAVEVGDAGLFRWFTFWRRKR